MSGARSWIHSRSQADDDGESDRAEREPQGYGRNVHRRQILPAEINVGSKGDAFADQPAERDSANASDKAHHARFREEESPNVAIISAQGFENADFAAAFENGHDESVDNTERGDGQSEATENSEEQIDHGEKQTEIASRVE